MWQAPSKWAFWVQSIRGRGLGCREESCKESTQRVGSFFMQNVTDNTGLSVDYIIVYFFMLKHFWVVSIAFLGLFIIANKKYFINIQYEELSKA